MSNQVRIFYQIDNVLFQIYSDSTSVMLEHFYLEDKQADQLYSHKAQVNLVTWDIDQSTGFVWCNFTRYVTSRVTFTTQIIFFSFQACLSSQHLGA